MASDRMRHGGEGVMRRTLASLPALLLVLAACGGPADTVDLPSDPDDEDAMPDVPEEPDDPASEPEEEPVTPPDDDAEEPRRPTVDDERLAVPVELAIADAAADLGIDEAAIELVSAAAVTWPDGAIGCPEPDAFYTQALVDGYRIVLEVDGEQLHYHGAWGDPPFRCDDPAEPLG
jgi:pyruvate/2-oxoglutarate dehydrogenase complex dihydrolipoamide acyltransferase (E2) component